MRSALRVGEPKHGALTRVEPRHGAFEVRLALGCAGIMTRRHTLDLVADDSAHPADHLLAPRIPSEVRGNPVERIASMSFGLMVRRGSKKPVERFLKQVVRELAVARD